jgi:hypothetical protein
MQRSYILAHDMSFSCGDSRIYFWSFVNSSSGTLFEESQVDRIHWASDGGELIWIGVCVDILVDLERGYGLQQAVGPARRLVGMEGIFLMFVLLWKVLA